MDNLYSTPNKRLAKEMSFSPDMSQNEVMAALLDQKLQPLHEKLDTALGISSEIAKLQDEVQELKSKNVSLQKKVESLEKYSRKNNLRIYNLKEARDENLELKFTDIINGHLAKHRGSNPFDGRTFEAVHRIGKPKQGKPRTVIARFCNHKDKQLVFGLRNDLKEENNISISDDFTQEEIKRRNQIYPIFKLIQHALSHSPDHDKKQLQLKQDT